MFYFDPELKSTFNSSFSDKTSILVVEDQEELLDWLITTLEDEYNVFSAVNGEEALNILKKHQEIKVLLSDHKMPVMTGSKLCLQAKKIQHPATRMMLTGFAEIEDVAELINEESIFRFLNKPIERTTLLSAVKEGIQNYNQRIENKNLLNIIKKLVEENKQLLKNLKSYDPSFTQINSILRFLEKPKKLPLTIMFLDIRGSTKFSQRATPSQILKVLQTIFLNVHETIYKYNGAVDKHLGDGLMAIFGLGKNTGLNAGIATIEEIIKNAPFILRNCPYIKPGEIKLSLGLSTGEVVLGMVGTQNCSELAVIGQAANLASRLQEYTKFISYKNPIFGYENAMAICPMDILEDQNHFIEYEIPAKSFVRDFHNLKKLGVIFS